MRALCRSPIVLLIAVSALSAPPSAASQERAPTPREIDSLKAVDSSLAVKEAELLGRAERVIAENMALTGRAPSDSSLAVLTRSYIAVKGDRVLEHRAREARRRDVFHAVLAVPLFINATHPFDRDAGGYISPWNSQDKYLHAAIASGIVSVGNAFGVPLTWASFGSCAASALYELTQAFPPGDAAGFGDPKDFVWACGSAIATAHVLALAKRLR